MAVKKNKNPRRRRQLTYKNFRLSKKIKPAGPSIPGVFSLLKTSWGLIRANRNLFIGIVAVHSLLSLVFVTGLGSSFDFVQTKQDVEEFLGDSGQVAATFALFGYLAAGAQAGEVAVTYQMLLTLLTSLAVIWAVRQVMAGERVGAKDAYYRGLYPLIPLLLVLFVVGLQLLPAFIGATLYNIVVTAGLAVTGIEKLLWLLLFVLLCIISLYFIISSVFALYIVTLPDMTPLRALRSARGLVLHRRIGLGLRIVALPLVLLLVGLAVLVPVIFFLPWLAVVLFLIYSSFSLCLAHTYMYNLYRSLL